MSAIDKLKIIRELKSKTEKSFPGCQVVLFGSQAKNEETIDSDFDVLIIVENPYNWKDKEAIRSICYDIEAKYNIFIDSHFLSSIDIKSLRGRQPFFQNALAKGIYA
jgi:predicted nucleotidyltransferase